MIKTTLYISDMACSMCEAHINDAVRNAFAIKKISSSHTKNVSEILSNQPLDENQLRDLIQKTGYTLTGIKSEPYEKKGIFRK